MKKTYPSPADNLSPPGRAVRDNNPAETSVDVRDLVILNTPADETVTDVHTDRLRQRPSKRSLGQVRFYQANK